MENFLEPIKVKIFYDENLKKITGKDFEEGVVSEGLNFINFLNFVFSSYPEIQKRFTPGTLGFLLNGKEPKENDILKDGDELKIITIKPEDARKGIESQLSEIIRHYQIDISFEEVKDLVFNEDGQEDFNKLIDTFTSKIDNIDEVNEVLKILNAVWNFFPHKALNGLSPTEKIESIRIQ